MAVSPLKFVQERARQERASDKNFFRKMTYYFELRVPQEVASGSRTSFLTPLIIPPESYNLEEPFTVDAVPTQGGGLYVEENGIVQRMIKLEGHTGFKPRNFGEYFSAGGLKTIKNKSYSRELPYFIDTELSGHKHFQYLQDGVFRTYADLKRDPATSEDTFLFFHNPKDDEHWLVVPQKFSLTRSSDKPVLYRYSIELLAVDKADAVDGAFSEDKGLLDKIKDAPAMIKSGLDLAAGAVNDLTALTSELTNRIKDFTTIMDGVTTIIDAGSNFVNGLSTLVEVPYSFLNSTIERIEAAGELVQEIEDLGTDVSRIPDTVLHKLRQMADALHRIGTHPGVFETPAQQRLREIRRSQELATSVSDETLQEAAASAAPQTLTAVESLGTAITPGDVQSAQSELGIGRAVIQYTSALQVEVAQGDTLVNLAARYLGDARLWQQIAILNGLNPPFVDDLASTPLDSDDPALPKVLGRGSKVLIPSFGTPPERQPLLPVLGVENEEDAEVHLLGADLKLERVGGREGAPLYDLAINSAQGSVDLKTVKGVANMAQAVQTRLSTEKGSDILFKRMGLDRMVSLNITPVDLETARFRFREAITQDQRIATARNIIFETGTDSAPADAVVIDATLELQGFSQSYTVRADIGG